MLAVYRTLAVTNPVRRPLPTRGSRGVLALSFHSRCEMLGMETPDSLF